MSLDGIDTLWSSPANRPDRAAIERHQRELFDRLRRERHRLTGIVSLVCVALAALTVAAAVALTGAAPAGGAGTRALLPLLALPWLALWRVARARRAHLDAHPAGGESIAAALAALADLNRRARARVRLIAALQAAAVPALALAVRALAADGRVRPGELPSLVAVLAGLLAAAALGAFAWDRFRLLPEQRHLRALLEAYA